MDREWLPILSQILPRVSVEDKSGVTGRPGVVSLQLVFHEPVAQDEELSVLQGRRQVVPVTRRSAAARTPVLREPLDGRHEASPLQHHLQHGGGQEGDCGGVEHGACRRRRVLLGQGGNLVVLDVIPAG